MQIILEEEITVECEGCGSVLNATMTRGVIYVEPCTSCLTEAEDRAYDNGMAEGYDDGFEAGLKEAG